MTAVGPAGPQGPQGDFTGLAPVFQKQLQQMIAASNGRVRLISGFRSAEQQQAALDIAAQRYGPDYANNWFADPLHSNHVKGAAGDLAGDLTVAHQLAPQFGLAFPMSWEPQHVEMVSTRLHASPQAYTTPPPGETNPTHADFSNSPPHLAATLAEALLPTTTGGLGTAGGLQFNNQGAQAIAAVENPDTASAQPAASPQGPSGSAGTSAGGANMTGKGNVSPTQLYGALTAAGLPPQAAAAFVSIAGRESGYNTGAFNGNASTGDKSYGLFQINLLNGGWTSFLQAHGMSDPASQLQTLQGSVQAAAAIYGASGLHPWGGYKGMPWSYNTNLQAGADASGGAVSVQDLQNLGGG
jgi:hypothetical protein